MVPEWLAQDMVPVTLSIPIHAAAAATQAAPTTEVATPMRVLMEGATIMAAITTTTTPDVTGAVATMDGPTADGAQGLAGVGDGAEHLGTDSMAITSTRILSMQLRHFGSLII